MSEITGAELHQDTKEHLNKIKGLESEATKPAELKPPPPKNPPPWMAKKPSQASTGAENYGETHPQHFGLI